MRVLRLANSVDTVGDIPPDMRSSVIAERALAAATGQSIETVARFIWPDPGLPELIARWIDRFEPDIVSLTVASYWAAYPSAPLKLQRVGGRAGETLGSLALRAADVPALSRNRLFQALRRRAVATIGAAYYFEPEAIVELMDVCFRRVLRLESVALAVRGPGPLLLRGMPGFEESEARRAVLREGVAGLCRKLDVPFRPFDPPLDSPYTRDLQTNDGIHPGVEGHAVVGAVEAELLVAAWQHASGHH